MIDTNDMSRRLERLLRHEGAGDDVVVADFTQLTGGYSLFTARFTATTPAGTTTYVLRANPDGDSSLTRTDRRREWELLSRLSEDGAVPMPAARWADVAGTTLGTPGIILDHVDGPQLLGHLQSADAAEHPELALQLATAIGRVHNAGEAIAPDSFERPDTWDAYIDSFVDGWRQVEAAYPEHNPFIRWVAAWLDAHRPPPAPLTLVHGEFQTGNVMLDSAGNMQVIDWEYAHVGDPRVDLGWIQNCAAFTPPDLVALDPMGFCARYCEVTGLTAEIINPLTIGWFSILGGYKALGALMQGMTAMAAGENRLLTSAYLVSAIPFTHQMWRRGVADMEAAMAAITETMEATR
jgi:aminoglycoside phosphotransferase (APT) family kinase protein